MVRKSIMAGVISLLLWLNAAALDPQKSVSQYIIDGWTEENGLPQSSVWAIRQTGDGFLWIGTEEGLVRFDGKRFTLFDANNTPAITANYIYCLFEDSKKNLWIGTLGGGFLLYKNETFQRLKGDENFSQFTIYCIHEDSLHNIWIGTDGGGALQWNEETESFRVYDKNAGLPDNVIRYIGSDSRGNLWAGTQGGLSLFRDNRFIPCAREGDAIKESFNAIVEDSKKNLWIGSNKGLYRMEEEKLIPCNIKNVSTIIIRGIYEDRDKNIWFSTMDSGLFRYTNGKFSAFSKKDGLLGDHVLAITEDREGNLWIGTALGGLNRLKDGKFTTITAKEGLADDIVYTIREDSQGALWFGTNNGLSRYQNGTFMHFTTQQGLSHNAVDTIYEDRQGFIWVGTDEGLNQLRSFPDKIEKIKDYLKGQYIPAICEDQSGHLWVGTPTGAVKIIENQVIQTLKQKDGLGGDFITFIYEDRRGNLWFGTLRAGITRYDGNHFTIYTQKDGLASDTPCCIYEDAEAVLWIGTNNGLSRYREGKFTSFTKKDGLFQDTIYQVLEDKSENFWISTNKGIFRVGKKDLADFARGKLPRIKSVVFGKNDGMRSTECIGGYQYAGCKTRDGKLWFPTVKGAVYIDPENIVTNPVVPPVLIELVLLDGVPAGRSGQTVVRPGTKRLEIHYTALSFTNPEKVYFQYKLEGYDDRWIDAGTRREAFYTNLDAGTYTFRVKACNNDGLWNKAGAILGLRVIPPYWNTWWFQLIALIAFAFLSYLVINFSRKYLTLAAFWKKQKFVGKFKLLDMIGSGGMGAVYKATNLMDKSETVAIKLLKEEMFADESSRKRFKQEAAIIDQLDHPNIVKVIERGQSKQSLFIAMEYLQGTTLAKKIQDEKGLAIPVALHIMIQSADALAKIHSKNIIHRDIKPENIMLVERDKDPNFVKILDFGLAKMQYQTRLTQTGIVIGTINYLSPEQISGKGSSPASDVYALGVIYYEMLTGEKPFFGETTIDIMKQIMDKTPLEPVRFREDIPLALNQLVMSMLDKERKSRPVIHDVVGYLRDIEANCK